jgi:hypothetical protein
MTNLTTQLMDIGGLLLRMAWILVSQVLFILLAGVIAVTLYVVVLYLIVVIRLTEKVYSGQDSASESVRSKLVNH